MCALLVSICLLTDLQLNDQKKKIRSVAIQGKWFISNVSVLWMSIQQRVGERGSGKRGNLDRRAWGMLKNPLFQFRRVLLSWLPLTYCNSSFSSEKKWGAKWNKEEKTNGVRKWDCRKRSVMWPEWKRKHRKKEKGWESEKIKFEYLETISWRWKLDCYSVSQIFPLPEKCQALFSSTFLYHWPSSALFTLREWCGSKLGLFVKWNT